MVGGLGAAREKDDEVAEVVEKVKAELEAKTNSKYKKLEILSYKTQLVAGLNYFVKVSWF